MNSGGNTGPGCVVSVLVSCDRLISPGYGKGIGNRPFSLFPVETLIENFATCGLRFAANRLASHLESVCNRANWSTIRAKFKSRSSYDTARLLSTRFQTAAPSLPPLDGKHRGDGWKAGNNPCGRNTRSPNLLFYLICLFLFLSILVPSFFPSSRNSIRVSVRLKENGILRFTGIVSLLLTSIRVLLLLLLFFYISGGLLLS